ncbi:MAG TPA: GNAT family N-acetyltransferase [Candidatus Nitrosotalea sp.]|nr:GNAT family N-acetyltransferase [Candidatus Nitrosotalea sp.]
MTALLNLIVGLGEDFPTAPAAEFQIAGPDEADEQTLAWIDDVFGGFWSSEADAGSSLIARCDGAAAGFATIDAVGLTFAWLDGLAREPGVGLFGPFGVAPRARDRGLGRELLRRALNVLRSQGYARALIPAVGEDLASYYAATVGARVAERFERPSLLRPRRRTLVLASGNGSNFQAVLDASRSGALPIDVVALLCDNPGAYALERARRAEVEAAVVVWDRAAESRAAYDRRLLEATRSMEPDLVLLLGWMHLLSDSYVDAFPEMLNLHPAFLPLDPARDEVVAPDGTRIPALRGARAVRDALAISSPWVGATLHRVTPATDRGPVLARRPLRVGAGEEEAALMERVHEIERDVVRTGVMRWLYER